MYKKSSCQEEQFGRVLELPRAVSSWGNDRARADGA